MSSTSRIIFSCPSCDAPLRGYAQQVGRQVRCPACSQSVVVPKSAKPSAEGEDWWAIDLPEGAVDVAPSLAKAPASTTARPPSTAPPSTAPPSSPPAKTNSTPNVDLRVRCDKCKTMLRVEAKVLGKKIRCPKCESVFVAGDEKPRTTAPVIDPNDFQFAPDPPAPTNTRGAKFDDTDPHAWLAANGFSLGEQTLDDLPDGSQLPTTSSDGTDPTTYRIRCNTCGSALTVRSSQTGKSTRCPDCFSNFTVPPPTAGQNKTAPAPTSPQSQADSEWSDTVPQSTAFPQNAMTKAAQDYMRDAEAAPVEKKGDMYDNPDVHGWFSHIFGIFTDPGVLVYLFGLSMIALVMAGLASIPPGPYVALAGLIQILSTGFLIGISLGCGMAILEGTSNNDERITGWPSSDPFEWLGNVFLVCTAVSLSGMPGFMLGLATGQVTAQVAFSLMSIAALFPIILMGMMDNGSLFAPYSSDIMLSLKRTPESWMTFYITSCILLFGFFALFVMSQFLPAFPKFFISFIAIAITIFLYMRMLGRLGVEIGRVLNREEPETTD